MVGGAQEGQRPQLTQAEIQAIKDSINAESSIFGKKRLVLEDGKELKCRKITTIEWLFGVSDNMGTKIKLNDIAQYLAKKNYEIPSELKNLFSKYLDKKIKPVNQCTKNNISDAAALISSFKPGQLRKPTISKIEALLDKALANKQWTEAVYFFARLPTTKQINRIEEFLDALPTSVRGEQLKLLKEKDPQSFQSLIEEVVKAKAPKTLTRLLEIFPEDKQNAVVYAFRHENIDLANKIIKEFDVYARTWLLVRLINEDIPGKGDVMDEFLRKAKDIQNVSATSTVCRMLSDNTSESQKGDEFKKFLKQMIEAIPVAEWNKQDRVGESFLMVFLQTALRYGWTDTANTILEKIPDGALKTINYSEWRPIIHALGELALTLAARVTFDQLPKAKR